MAVCLFQVDPQCTLNKTELAAKMRNKTKTKWEEARKAVKMEN